MKIPVRTSSLYGTSITPAERGDERGVDGLKRKREALEKDIHTAKKKLKPQGSFSIDFWTTAAEISQLRKVKLGIHRKISIADFNGSEAAWQMTPAAQELIQQEHALATDEKCSLQQVDRLSKLKGREKSFGSSFIKLFTTSKMGLEIKHTGMGRRDTSDQTNFKADMIHLYACAHGPDPTNVTAEHLWCPILKRFFLRQHTTAAHLFSYKHGQETMEAIFGPMNPPELMSPHNGMIISTVVENVFDTGMMALVPDFDDTATPVEREAWESSEPKNYKIKIVDPDHQLANREIEPTKESKSKKWRDLHGEKVEFPSDFRPRARYLYFHYCMQVMRASWNHTTPPESAGKIIRGEMGKKFWGTKGRYVPDYMLRVFIQEIGQVWEEDDDDDAATEVASNLEGDGMESTLLQTMVNQALEEKPELKDDDLDEDEDEDEELVGDAWV